MEDYSRKLTNYGFVMENSTIVRAIVKREVKNTWPIGTSPPSPSNKLLKTKHKGVLFTDEQWSIIAIGVPGFSSLIFFA